MHSAGTIALRVTARRQVAADVALIELGAADGRDLPAWQPGAHIDLIIDSGAFVRPYSLCGDPRDTKRWTIAVLREPKGRGGSIAVHDRCFQGAEVAARVPHNNFPLARADHSVFVAGGIGITPFLPMIGAIERAGGSWELHYAGRARATMAFADELTLWHGSRVHCYPAADGQRLSLRPILREVRGGAEVYACGPARLLNEVETICREGRITPHLERFAAPRQTAQQSRVDTPFEVCLARSGVTLNIEPGQSILSAAEMVGADVFGSCLEGVCGTCETRVLEGVPEHRDHVLAGLPRDRMMICVSRAAGGRLVLDI